MAEVEATIDNLNIYVGRILFRLYSNLVLSRLFSDWEKRTPDDHVSSSTCIRHDNHDRIHIGAGENHLQSDEISLTTRRIGKVK